MDLNNISLENSAGSFLSLVEKIWHFVLISVGDKQIKLSNIFIAFFSLYFILKNYHKIAPFLVCRLVSSASDENKEVIEKIFSILVGVVVTIFILQMANIPLESFAFLGGALALGLGLGIQNLINNFLSSLIIVIEKPLVVGDIVTIDNKTGQVTEVGNRCITLRSASNSVIFVPSSTILQNSLTNWTKDHQFFVHRLHLKVPKVPEITYNSDAVIDSINSMLEKDNQDHKVKSSKVILESVDVKYYIYLISYKTNIQAKGEEFKHRFNTDLINKLGSDIIIENVDIK